MTTEKHQQHQKATLSAKISTTSVVVIGFTFRDEN
jgi:hypothetical protein